jgi:hypothetical protein
VTGLSTSQINKAGRVLKKRGQGEFQERAKVLAAYDVLLAYRAEHQAPLGAATMGLRSMVNSEKCRVEVSQRLKRVPTIVDKLVREPTLPLATMQDIGGCRAVLDSIDELRRVEARLRKRRPPVRPPSDYVKNPRSSGYRGVHVVVSYHGRCIEVQLRTQVMHAWAITVERVSGRLGANMKMDGEHPIQQLLSVISHAMAIEELGLVVDSSLIAEMDQLRALAAPYLLGGAG